MVVVTKKTWLPDMRLRFGNNHNQSTVCGDSQTTLGILAFETARTMARLVSLHRSLSDPEVTRLRDDTMKSIGVAYLNSTDQCFLFRLACAEMVDDLDRAAAAISRLCRRCCGVWPCGFDRVYADLKSGAADIGHLELGLQPREVAKRVKRMEKFVAATSALRSEMESLAEMEVSELKLQRWNNNSGTIPVEKPNTDLFLKKLARQRRKVRRLREESLWNQSFDRVAKITAAAAVSAFARICSVFGPHVSDLPSVVSDRKGRVGFSPHRHLQSYHHHRAGSYSSGPLERTVAENVIIRNSGPILRTPARTAPNPWKNEVLEAPTSTLGATGLALRYANVIALVEKMALSPELRGDASREELYHMLPVGLRAAVSAKLRNCWKMDSSRLDDGGLLASGWTEAVGRILGWLAPMAQDTMQWQLNRSYERHRLDSDPRVLLLQTLWFSDKEKAEAAIVEVLVGLSYICRYQQCAEKDIDEL